MIRTSVERETVYPEAVTIRTVTDWHKRMTRLAAQTTAEEQKYIDQRWVALVTQLAQAEGVPVGWLSWAVSQLAEYELRLLATASAEGEVAVSAAQPTSE